MKIYELFNLDSYQRSRYRLANGNTKYDNHGGGQAMLLTQRIVRTRCATGLLRTLSINGLITRQIEITEKNTNKGITELSNILTG